MTPQQIHLFSHWRNWPCPQLSDTCLALQLLQHLLLDPCLVEGKICCEPGIKPAGEDTSILWCKLWKFLPISRVE